jgi:acyl-CoA reductase-like NAD-dependent aldehyde dehydrogenase
VELEQHAARILSLSRTDMVASYDQRKDRLLRLESLVVENRAALLLAMASDFGVRSHDESDTFDLLPTLAEIRGQRRDLRAAMRPRRRQLPWYLWPARASLVPEPLGVVGVMSPWNFPLYLALAPVAAALAAGNRVLLKPSELAPATSEVISTCVARAFASEELSVWLGDAALAARFSAIAFDHLLFTGSTTVGRAVARSAAINLTPVTLELGGKSPALVLPSADLRLAAARIIFGKLINAGQICIAPDYALVPRAQLGAFVAAVRATAKNLYPSFAGNPDYTALRAPAAAARMDALVQDAESRGATLVRLRAEADAQGGLQRTPVLVLDPPADARVLEEELFAPILPIVPYDTLDDAIAFINARPRPLALYAFGSAAAEVDAVLQRTRTGGVTVNDVFYHCGCGTLPFGGIGPSGMGVYHGRAGFDTFSHLKPIYRQSRLHAGALFSPPYGPRKARLRDLLRRFV